MIVQLNSSTSIQRMLLIAGDGLEESLDRKRLQQKIFTITKFMVQTKCIKEKVNNAISANPALMPSEMACGKGIGFVPSVVDQASSHTGKISQEIKKTERNE